MATGFIFIFMLSKLFSSIFSPIDFSNLSIFLLEFGTGDILGYMCSFYSHFLG